MSETRRPDPLRRVPTTIDLPARDVKVAGAEPSPDPAAGPEDAQDNPTAIEPVAVTGLGSDPFPTSSVKPTGSSAGPAGPPASPVSSPPSPVSSPPSPTDTSAKATAAPAASGGLAASPAEAPKKAPGTPTSPGSVPAGSSSSPKPQTVPPLASSPPAAGATAKATSAGTESPLGAKDTKPAPGPAPAGTAAEPRAAARGPGFGRLAAASLVGGVVGAALATGAARLLPDGRTDERLAAIERRVAALPAGNTTALEGRIAALETGLRQAGDDSRAARASAEAAARQASEVAARPPGSPAADPAIRQTLDGFSARLDEGARLASANATAIAELDRKVGTLDGQARERSQAATAAVESLGSSLRGVQTELGSVKAGVALIDTRSGETERRLANLSGEVATAVRELARLSPGTLQAGLQVVVSGRLDDALRSGAPLGPVLTALEKLGVTSNLLAPLQPFATAPPPTPAGLAAEWRPLAAALTAEPPRPDESFMDKVRRLLGRVVTVRSVGDGSGGDVPGLVARIDAALARGALADAAGEWNRLPDGAKATTAPWAERLRARVAADAAARRIGAVALAGLDATTR